MKLSIERSALLRSSRRGPLRRTGASLLTPWPEAAWAPAETDPEAGHAWLAARGGQGNR